MCLKTISKTEVSAFISCSLLSIHTCSYELYLKFRTQKKRKDPFNLLMSLKLVVLAESVIKHVAGLPFD